jgi:hypothetical protein
MDGLSLAISVATIIQFTGACLELSRKWIGPSEFSTSDLTTTRRALVGFNRALVDFQKYLQANEHNEARLSILDHLKPALDQCEKALNILKVFIEEPSITKKHFIGPIFDSQLKESLKDLDDAKELFKLAQQADLQ